MAIETNPAVTMFAWAWVQEEVESAKENWRMETCNYVCFKTCLYPHLSMCIKRMNVPIMIDMDLVHTAGWNKIVWRLYVAQYDILYHRHRCGSALLRLPKPNRYWLMVTLIPAWITTKYIMKCGVNYLSIPRLPWCATVQFWKMLYQFITHVTCDSLSM